MLKGLAAAATALVGLVVMTGAAVGPAHGTLEPLTPPLAARASIEYVGSDPILTGSVDDIFSSGSFVGPNRSAKTDRARYMPDVLTFTRSFEDLRTRLLADRLPAFAAVVPAAAGGAQARIVVASLSPPPHSQALDAIDTLSTPAAGVPMPAALSQKIAYARAETPATVFGAPVAPGKTVSDKELWCLATAIYFEARGEAYRGQVGVAQVVLNRVKHKLYPGTICGVVFQNQEKRNACQFSFACDGIPDRVTDQKSWKQAQDIAKGAARGDLYLAEVGHSTHYHATYVSPHWAPRMTKVTKIGLHVFYQFRRGWKFG